MNNKLRSCNPFVAFCRGIKKAVRWVARMFGYKAKTKFGKVVWCVFATSVTLLTLILALALTIVFVNEGADVWRDCKYRRKTNRLTYLHDYQNQYVSPYVIYHNGTHGYLYNTLLEQRTVVDIFWICKSSDGDSLTCFSTSDSYKRGYFNRFTGELAIPAVYEKAWVFSEGLACVMKGGQLHFIDHKGEEVMDKVFPYSQLINDYCFYEGLCCVPGDNNRVGFIDKQGNWVVSPEFYKVSHDEKGFWLVQDRECKYGLLDSKGQMLLPIEYSDITINHTDSCIYVCHLDHLEQVLDFECNIVNPCNYHKIEKLEYAIDEFDESRKLKLAIANCLRYTTTEGYYGLIDREGNIVTPPDRKSVV